MAFCSTSFNYFMNAAWKKYANENLGIQGEQLGLVLTISGIFESVSGLIAGTIVIYVPFKVYYICQVCVQLVATLTIYHYNTNFVTMSFYLSLSMFLLGADKTLYPTISQKIFGPIAGPKIYPMVYVFFSFSSIYQFVLFSEITQDYELIFYIFSAMTGVCLVCASMLNMQPDWTSYYNTESGNEEKINLYASIAKSAYRQSFYARSVISEE